jgi:hypothetical protein
MLARRHIPPSLPERPQHQRHPCAHPVLPNEPKSPFRIPGVVASPRAKPSPHVRKQFLPNEPNLAGNPKKKKQILLGRGTQTHPISGPAP